MSRIAMSDPEEPASVRNTAHHRAQVGIQAGYAAYNTVSNQWTENHYYGTRGYCLEPFPEPAEIDVARLKAQPSRLLDARSRIVGFHGRETELRQLKQWCDAENQALSVLLLHAPGGQGKSRLAAEFVQHSREGSDLWHVLQARMGAEAKPANAPHDASGVLVVVDYAEMWTHSELIRLFDDLAVWQSIPVRVLLVSRTVRWFPALRAGLEERYPGARSDDILLTPLADERMSMFAAARDRFCRPDLYDRADADEISPPGALDHPDFGLTLTVHMAALAAVDAHSRGKRAPSSPHELSAYLLDREYLAWYRLREQGQDYGTKPAVMAKLVFAATLTGAMDYATGKQAMKVLELPGELDHLLDDHRYRYPSPGGAHVLEPLYPDRLAEDFVALLTPGHGITSYEPDPWTVDVPALLLKPESSLRSKIAQRTVTTLAAAADRWPHLRKRVLQPLLLNDADVALEAGSAALTAIAAIGARTDAIPRDLLETLEAIDAIAPMHNIDLDIGLLSLTERLAKHRLALTGDPAERAFTLGHLGFRRGNVGEWASALDADKEAVHLFATLAEEDSSYRPWLARMKYDLAHSLVGVGRWQEAIAQAHECVALTRELAQHNPEYRDLLVTSLLGLGAYFDHADRSDAALEVIREAVGICREAQETDPDAISDLTAWSALRSLGGHLIRTGDAKEASAVVEEAVALARRLEQADPTQHLSTLASTLMTLSDVYKRRESDQSAVEAQTEAIGFYQRLAKANPQVYQPRLVDVLHEFSQTLNTLGRGDEARAALEDALALARELYAANPVNNRGRLAKVLTTLGIKWAILKDDDQALEFFKQASDLHSGSDRPEISNLDEQAVLLSLAEIYRRKGDFENEAECLLNVCTVGSGRPPSYILDAGLRAVELYRRLGDRFWEAGALVNLASLQSHSGQHDEAIANCRRGTEIYRELGENEVYVRTLTNLAAHMIRAEHYDNAVAVAQHAEELSRELGPDYPRGQILFNLGNALLESGEAEQAITLLEQAAAVYESSKGEFE